MKRLALFFLLFSMIVSVYACGLANSKYLVRSFDLEEVQSAPVGSPMIIVENGLKNDVYKWVVSGHRRELVYSGIDGKVLQITYREYDVDRRGAYIKDGFTQHLKYDLTDSDIIQFRDTKIQIVDVNPSSIEFRVVESTEEVKRGSKDQELRESRSI